MSFRISLADIIELSGVAYTVGKALTSGRKSAPEEFQEVQNQLFAIGNALKVLSATVQEDASGHGKASGREDEDEALSRMIDNCRTTLKHLDTLLQKYPELTPDSSERLVDESTQKRYRKGLKDNIKKVKWTTEGAGLDRLKQNLATHVNALNLAIAARSYLQAGARNGQVDDIHERLGDIHAWFLTHVKDAKKAPERPRRVGGEGNTVLTFSIILDISNDMVCSKATLKADWIRTQGQRIFDCLCGCHHDLNYTREAPWWGGILEPVQEKPNWKLHVFSREQNSVVSLMLTNIPTTYQAEFRRCVDQLSLTQGARSSAMGTNSMLMYTSIDEDHRGSLSILNTQGNTTGFRGNLQSVTLISNRLRYIVEAIESAQALHYAKVSTPEVAAGASTPHKSPELLPFRHGELVLHTSIANGNSDSNITQLILKFDHQTVIDEARESVSIMRSVECRVILDHDEQLDIQQADVELAFTTLEGADSCRSSLKALQRHLFLSYLQFQRENEIVQSRKYIGDVMIQDMQLLDAQATIVYDLATNEQRMIISSKCGSKFVTVTMPAVLPGPLSKNGLEITPSLPAFFVDISTEDTKITKQHTSSALGGVVLGGLLG